MACRVGVSRLKAVGDRANGLRTVPVILGRARTLRLLHVLNGLLALLSLGVPLLGLARPAFVLLGVRWGAARAGRRGALLGTALPWA